MAGIILALIYLVMPACGLLLYFRLLATMKNERVADPPSVSLFIVFLTYGGLLLVAVTAFLGSWSGMATVGVIYLILVAPIACFLISFAVFGSRRNSIYHQVVFLLSFCYAGLSLLLWALFMICFSNTNSNWSTT